MQPGRPKGAASRRRQELTVRAIANGSTPLEYMIAVMRDPDADPARRDEMARAAAPYVHPRLAAVDISGEVTTTYVARMPAAAHGIDDWQRQHGPPKAETIQ